MNINVESTKKALNNSNKSPLRSTSTERPLHNKLHKNKNSKQLQFFDVKERRTKSVKKTTGNLLIIV